VSVLNDKEFGGILHRQQGQWQQLNQGLEHDEVFDLARSSEGILLAATNHGLYLLPPGGQQWEPSKSLLLVTERPVTPRPVTPRPQPAQKAAPRRSLTHKRPALASRSTGQARRRQLPQATDPSADDPSASSSPTPRPGAYLITHSTFEGRVNALAVEGPRWYAAASTGILVSDNQGESWSRCALDSDEEFSSVAAYGQTAAAVTPRRLWYSGDAGEHWWAQPLPAYVTRISSVAVSQAGELWIATPEGALRWRKISAETATWERIRSLPPGEIGSVRQSGEWLVAVAGNTAYLSHDNGKSWQPQPPADFPLSSTLRQGETLYLLTRQHGLLERDLPENAGHSGAGAASAPDSSLLLPKGD
jgi:hypothetical protein